MYNDYSFFTLHKRKIVTILCFTIFISLLIFTALHGFLQINSMGTGEKFTYASYNNQLHVDGSLKSGGINLFSSGDYSIQTATKSGGIESRFVSVPYFLQTKKITRDASDSRVEPLARGVGVSLTATINGLASWDGSSNGINPLRDDITDNSTVTGSSDDNFPNFNSSTQLSKSIVSGLVKFGDNYMPVIYDRVKQDSSAFSMIKSEQRSIIPKAEFGAMSIYDQDKKTIRLYQPGASSSIDTKITDDPVSFNGRSLFSASKSTTVTTTGDPIVISNENEEADVRNNLTLSVIDVQSKKTVVSRSFNGMQPQNIQLTGDGKFLAIETNQSLGVYSTYDLSLAFALPFGVSDFMWINDTDFAVITTDQGLFVGSTKTKRAATVVAYKVLRPTKLSFSDGDWLYFTAYSDTSGVKNPDAYKVSLSQKSTAFLSKALKELPKQGDGYYLDYINEKLVIQLTKYIYSSGSSVNEDSKKRAEDHIRKLFRDDYPEIKYIYNISDLRKDTSTEE